MLQKIISVVKNHRDLSAEGMTQEKDGDSGKAEADGEPHGATEELDRDLALRGWSLRVVRT